MTTTLNSNLSDAVLCHVNGWEVGTVLEGIEYDPSDPEKVGVAHGFCAASCGLRTSLLEPVVTDAEMNATVALLLGWPERNVANGATLGPLSEPRSVWWGGSRAAPHAWVDDRSGARLFTPATDIRDAWLVVEWLTQQEAVRSVEVAHERAEHDPAWLAAVATDRITLAKTSDAAPRAICEAALAWAEARKEVEEPTDAPE